MLMRLADAYAPRPFAADPALGLSWAEVRALGEQFGPHAHQALLIGLNRRGFEEFRQLGRPGLAGPGMVRVIPAGHEHEGGPPPGQSWSYDVVYVPAARAALLAGLDPQAAFPDLRAAVLADPALSAQADALFRALAAGEPLAVAEWLSALLARIARVHAVAALPPVAAVRHRAVERARDLLHVHAAGKLTLDRLAHEAGLSKFHLIRSFRAQTGLTPWQYQVRLRMEIARRMLAHGRLPAEVAQAAGFADQSHFTRTFRALQGVTPGRFAAVAGPRRRPVPQSSIDRR